VYRLLSADELTFLLTVHDAAYAAVLFSA